MKKWIVVSDFDGTLSQRDIGNELCLEVFPERFHELHGSYRKGELDLKSMQKLMWEKFPLPQARFLERSLFHGHLRPGVNEFFERCADHEIPVFVASCGLRPYIEVVLQERLSVKAKTALKEIRCNESDFDEQGIANFIPPQSRADCPYPLDKGAWAKELAERFGPEVKILGIGNGTSDRSFVGHVHKLAATEALATWCQKNGHDYIPFEDFIELNEALERGGFFH